MQDCARINILIDHDGTPCVQFEPCDAFKSLEPLDKATVIVAAREMCLMVIRSILDEFPEETDEVMARMSTLNLLPGVARPN